MNPLQLNNFLPGDEGRVFFRSWKYSFLAAFLALVLVALPFDTFGENVLPKYKTGYGPPIYKFVFVLILYRFISHSKWFQSL